MMQLRKSGSAISTPARREAKEIVQKEVETVVGLDFAMDGLYVSSEDEKAN